MFSLHDLQIAYFFLFISEMRLFGVEHLRLANAEISALHIDNDKDFTNQIIILTKHFIAGSLLA